MPLVLPGGTWGGIPPCGRGSAPGCPVGHYAQDAAPPRRGSALKTAGGRIMARGRPAPAGVCPEDGRRPHHGQRPPRPAGVCPRYRFCPGYGNRPPRPCGDLPQERQRPRTDTQTAPHGRGAAVFAALSPASGTGRSARAEIRPRHRAYAARTARPPRTGGGPPLPAAVLTLAAASPPGRGSAHCLEDIPVRAQGSPAGRGSARGQVRMAQTVSISPAGTGARSRPPGDG